MVPQPPPDERRLAQAPRGVGPRAQHQFARVQRRPAVAVAPAQPYPLGGQRGRVEIVAPGAAVDRRIRSEEHTSELQSLMRSSYAVFCLKKKKMNKSQEKAE